MAAHEAWTMVLKGYAARMAEVTEVQVILQPSEVNPERFHVDLSPLPHPVVIGNGRYRFRLRAQVGANLPPSDRGVSDALAKSLQLAVWFGSSRGFLIGTGVNGMAYHTPLRNDDELFVDATEDKTYGYEEFWLVELEFDIETARVAVIQGD